MSLFRQRRESARELLKNLHPLAVRYAEAKGLDVWAIWCDRRADPIRWEMLRAGASVAAALTPICEYFDKRKKKP